MLDFQQMQIIPAYHYVRATNFARKIARDSLMFLFLLRNLKAAQAIRRGTCLSLSIPLTDRHLSLVDKTNVMNRFDMAEANYFSRIWTNIFVLINSGSQMLFEFYALTSPST